MSKSPKNQLWLDLRCSQGRMQVCVDVGQLNVQELGFLFALLRSGTQGSAVSFGVGDNPSGDHVMQFTFAKLVAAQPIIAGADHVRRQAPR